jgi:hypothetical protein
MARRAKQSRPGGGDAAFQVRLALATQLQGVAANQAAFCPEVRAVARVSPPSL